MKLRDLATKLKVPQDRIIEVGLDIDIDLDDYPNDIPQNIADKIAAKIKGDTKQLAAATLSTPAPSTSQPTTEDVIAAATTPQELARATGGGAYSNSVNEDITADLQAEIAHYKAIADAAIYQQTYNQRYWQTREQLENEFSASLVGDYKSRQVANQGRFESVQNDANKANELANKHRQELNTQLASIKADIENIKDFLSPSTAE